MFNLIIQSAVKNNVFVKHHVFKSKYEAAIVLLGRHVSEKVAETLWIAEDSKPEVADNLIDTAVTSQPQDNENTEPTKELGTIPNGEGEDGKAASANEVNNPLPTDSKDETVVYRLNDDWIQATNSIVDGGFLVHEKADFSGAEARAIARKYHDLRSKLLNEGCVKNNARIAIIS